MYFIREYPRIQLMEYVTSRQIDLLAENFDVAIRAHSGALPDSTLVSRTLAGCPLDSGRGNRLSQANWDRFTTPSQGHLKKLPPLFSYGGRTQRPRGDYDRKPRRSVAKSRRVTLALTPRMVSNDLSTLKQAAVNGMGVAALPAYVCKGELRSRKLTRILPGWLAGESAFTARFCRIWLGLLPAVRIFVGHSLRVISLSAYCHRTDARQRVHGLVLLEVPVALHSVASESKSILVIDPRPRHEWLHVFFILVTLWVDSCAKQVGLESTATNHGLSRSPKNPTCMPDDSLPVSWDVQVDQGVTLKIGRQE